MATSGPVIARFSEAAGAPASTVDRMLRVLRPAGLAPIGRPGRGTTEGVFAPFHLACLILGFAGAQPSDAAEAAETLRQFERYHSKPPQKARIPGTLGDVIEALIAGKFESIQKTPDVTCYTPDLLLSLGPPAAHVRWPDGKGGFLIEIYGPKKGVAYTFNNGGIQRQTLVKGSMIDAAVSLWRDTPKNEDADPLAGGPAPLTAVQHKAEQERPNTSEPTAGRSSFQQRTPTDAQNDPPFGIAARTRADHGERRDQNV
jgi:hypothetical protein